MSNCCLRPAWWLARVRLPALGALDHYPVPFRTEPLKSTRNTPLPPLLVTPGRVLVRGMDGKIVQKLVKITRPIMRVPMLAIHLNRDINTEGFKPNTQSHLSPILATAMKAGTPPGWGPGPVLNRALMNVWEGCVSTPAGSDTGR